MYLQIINMQMAQIKPYPNNPRKNADAVKYVAASIKEFGFKQPIVIDRDNVIIAGHTRYLAAKELKLKEIPCLMADDLTNEQIKAYRIADNKTAEFAEWDLSMLDAELDGIFDLDMSEFGFMDEPEKIEPQENDFDVDGALTDDPVAKLGDIWQLGRHRLMCGDSTDSEAVALLMDGVKADMVFTDPPYGVNYQSNMRTKTQKFDVIENDDKLLDFVPLCLEHSKGFIFICTSWKVLKQWLDKIDGMIELSNMIIWDKGGGGIGDLKKTFSTDYEVIMCANRGNAITGKRIGSVWNVGKDNANKYNHPTQKPIKLSAMAIENTTKLQDTVLDLFGGSGSTLIACEQLDRICYMMELDPKYIDVIIKRWEQFTGGKTILTNEVR